MHAHAHTHVHTQVEHHLFPTVCHCHHAALHPIVVQVCDKYKVRVFMPLSLSAPPSSPFPLCMQANACNLFDNLMHNDSGHAHST